MRFAEISILFLPQARRLTAAQSGCNLRAPWDIYFAPVIGQGAGAPPRLVLSIRPQNALGRGLAYKFAWFAEDRLFVTSALLPAEAIGLGHLSLRLVTRRRPGCRATHCPRFWVNPVARRLTPFEHRTAA
jgi:hypothetical protein